MLDFEQSSLLINAGYVEIAIVNFSHKKTLGAKTGEFELAPIMLCLKSLVKKLCRVQTEMDAM